jgi:Flp pilus assembly protein TadD
MKTLLAALLIVLTSSAPESIASPSRIHQALDAWSVPKASRAAKRLKAEDDVDGKILLALGRLALMEGRYELAVTYLSSAHAKSKNPRVAHFLELARSTWDETRDYLDYRTKAGNFVVRYPDGPDKLLLPYLDDVLERAFIELTQVFGHIPPTPIRVEIYPQAEVLAAVSPLTVEEIKTSGTIALCKYNRLMAVSPRALVYGYSWADTLAHEFIHLLVSQKSGNRVPIWMHEGLARYYQERWRGVEAPKLSRASEHLMAQAIGDKNLISFEDMSPSMAKLPSQDATALAFAEVFSAMEFMVRRKGAEVPQKLVSLMGAGLSDREAVAKVSGLPWNRFEGQWKQFIRSQGYRLQKDGFRQRMLFKGENTESEELALLRERGARQFTWLGDQLRVKDRLRAAAIEYTKASKISKRSSPIVQAKLGHALLALGRADEALGAMKKLTATYPNYVLLQLYTGRAYAMLGEFEQARSHLEYGIYLNPFDPEIHGLLGQVYQALKLTKLATRERKIHKELQKL